MTNLPDDKKIRQEAHRKAALILKSSLKIGDRIRATRAECYAKPATYTFAGWDGGWIVSASGIDTILPASVTSINGRKIKATITIAESA